MRWTAVILLLVTGWANLWFNWANPTPWALDCCFGPGDGQPAGLPVALIHTAVAAVITIPRYAPLGVLLGLGLAVLSALVWAFLSAHQFSLYPLALPIPSRANGSWAELLILPGMLLAYLMVIASLGPEARRALGSGGSAVRTRRRPFL